MIDLHSHHERCGHAQGTLEDMARAAHARGVRVFGWSDHAPLFADPEDHPRPGTQMARSQWDGYLSEAEAVRARLAAELAGLDLRIGVEADYLPGTEATYRAALDRDALDYVLGSVHEVGPWHIYKPRTFAGLEDVDAFHHGYWEALRGAAQSGLFDVLSHLDAIKAMVPSPCERMDAEIEQTLDCIADTGIAVEINGSGLSKAGELFPSPRIVEALVERDVPITLGSDAHRAAQLGRGFPEAAAMLKGLGRTRVITFRRREPEWVELS
ncbi:MAG: histidinol-phosphatase [Deinococcales bacterium]